MSYLQESIFPSNNRFKNSADHKRFASWTWLAWYAWIIGITSLLGLLALRDGPSLGMIGWILYLIGAVVILIQPRFGVYLIVFFSLIGDQTLNYWYPFNANFSSQGSILFISDSLIFSPLELYLVLTFVSWIVRGLVQRDLRFYKSELFRPAIVFIGFVIFGLGYGIGRGGSPNVGLWESRSLFYLPAMLVLTSNLLTKREHVIHLIWITMLATFLVGVSGTWYTFVTLKGNLTNIQEITEHSTAIQLNSFLVFAIAMWIYKDRLRHRLVLPLMLIPVLITLIATQRRAAYTTLFIAFVLIAFVLYKENRTAFWLIVPATTLIFLVYLAVFWNNAGIYGLPAQAIKSQIAPNAISTRDQNSDTYRLIENYDIYSTIRANPLTGIGFGQMFYMVIPLPDISFFVWWRYITHNSILWIWMKTGAGGFLAMLFLVGLSIIKGIQTLFRMPPGIFRAIALTATLYIVMHILFAYVDMAWFTQSMIYMGSMMGVIGCLEEVVGKPVHAPANRWPWQPKPEPVPGLVPLDER